MPKPPPSALRGRLALVRALAPARPPLLAALTAVLLADAAAPAASALALAALVGRLGDASTWAPLAAFAAVLATAHAAEAAAQPLEFLARARIDGAHRTTVARLASGRPTVDALENPDVQGLLRTAKADPEYGVDSTPADGALGQLRQAAALLGAAAACAVLAGYAWWLVPLVLLPAAALRWLRVRESQHGVGMWRHAIKEELHADVWRQAAVSAGEGKDIRTFGFADWMVHRMQHHIDVGNEPLWTHIDRTLRRSWLPFLLVTAGLLPAFAAVALGAARGHAGPAALTAVVTAGYAVFTALGPADDNYRVAGAVQVLRATDRLREACGDTDRPSPPDRHPEPPNGTQAPPHVRFENVSFRYPGAEHPVLDGLDLDVRPGELLAVVGLNGAGKSTLIKLLAGLYEPDAGRITAAGTDIAELGTDAWRRQLSVVFQDFVRYELPAADNVTLGHAWVPPDPSALAAAARDAGLHEVLRRLPDGWRTPLSRSRTGGVDLSGGQWQQVVLARALYAVRTGARLLVLDEPTAHLDVRTEFEVFRRLADRRGGTSVVLISHRLSTVRQADRIVLLDGGRITESGTHDELMALGGEYARLFAIQAERFREAS